MTPLRSFASVRSYYFRDFVARIDAEQREYGWGRSVEDYTLDDFRLLFRAAHNKANEWRRRATTIWNDQTKIWEQRK